MKGVILAGGSGTRLYPLTKVTNKHLLPIYDKPLIYYPLSNLLLAGCNEILIISNPDKLHNFENLFETGERFGIKIYYKEQKNPEGIPSAIKLSEDFVDGEDIWVSLGDNLIFGSRVTDLYELANKSSNPTVFLKHVGNIEGFGSAEIIDGKVTNLIEKPKKTNPGWAITGLYKFPNSIYKEIPSLKASKRNETEIVDLLNLYLEREELSHQIFGRGVTWIDCGTNIDLNRAENFVFNYQTINNTLICSPEEIALNLSLVTKEEYLDSIRFYENSDYSENLKRVLS